MKSPRAYLVVCCVFCQSIPVSAALWEASASVDYVIKDNPGATTQDSRQSSNVADITSVLSQELNYDEKAKISLKASVSPFAPIGLHVDAASQTPLQDTNRLRSTVSHSFATWKDTLVVEPTTVFFEGLPSILLIANFTLDGKLNATTSDRVANHAAAEVKVQTKVGSNPVQTDLVRNSDFFTDVHYQFNPLVDGIDVPLNRTYHRIDIRRQTPFLITIRAEADSGATDSSESSASASFGSTLHLTGYTLYDLEGHLLPSNAFRIISSSGVEYPVFGAPVPEPSMTVLSIAGGALGIAGTVRLRRRRLN